MDDETLDREIAASLGLPLKLLPFAGALHSKADALGSSPGTIVSVLRPFAAELKAGQVLDLGSGLGAVGIALAHDLGVRVLGVDAYEPFVEEARLRAAKAGVADRVTFRRDDFRRMLPAEGRFDLVLWTAMGSLLGDLRETVGALRRVVRKGGFVAIEGEAPDANGMADMVAARAALTAHGDEVLREVAVPAWQTREADQALRQGIRNRGEDLASHDPFAAATLMSWLGTAEPPQRTGHEHVWLLRKK